MPTATERVRKEIVVPARAYRGGLGQLDHPQESILHFFAPETVIEPKVGGTFHINIDPYGKSGNDAADDMRLMSLQEPTTISFTSGVRCQ